VPWGEKAFARYLGEDRAAWRAHDACELLAAGAAFPREPLIDVGTADKFLDGQLRPDLLEKAGMPVRRHAGYDHSYWFIQTFAEEHLRFHASA
jgi:S-formylglutathione hydrolase